MFSVENIFDLARYRATKKSKDKRSDRKQIVVSVYAPKGGVGKTTIAGNLATCFALRGLKTLVIDMDFQANLTLSFGYDSELTPEEAAEVGKSAEDVIEHHFGNLMPNWPMGRSMLSDVVRKPYGENGPHLIPADLTLDRLDTVLTYEALEGKNADLTIAKLLRDGRAQKDPHFDISDYDVVVFDAPPSKNRITRGALLASDYVLCPVSMEKFSTKALSYLSSVLTEMHDDFGRSPELIVVANFFDPARVRVMSHFRLIMERYGEALLQRWIRRSEDFPKALENEADAPLILSKPGSNGADDLRTCADAVLERMKFGVTDA
ncbi:ParA family protein [Paraburkholderia sp. WP4_3_2]|uniref:ParA family protein n=1 Tax=Paraburkholderia sp. WP4_3_2 TaxID=2587162 RepID=UPI00160FA2FA|nr:ParA family protein [Paraburkholderia sp. WP4_3_2]MBB3261275.1 chromosome partitioning protein [Paraburkholderia sp. WP4_3_2]